MAITLWLNSPRQFQRWRFNEYVLTRLSCGIRSTWRVLALANAVSACHHGVEYQLNEAPVPRLRPARIERRPGALLSSVAAF